ncbi:MAG: protein translocase subunit SecD [Thermogutta sp.]
MRQPRWSSEIKLWTLAALIIMLPGVGANCLRIIRAEDAPPAATEAGTPSPGAENAGAPSLEMPVDPTQERTSNGDGAAASESALPAAEESPKVPATSESPGETSGPQNAASPPPAGEETRGSSSDTVTTPKTTEASAGEQQAQPGLMARALNAIVFFGTLALVLVVPIVLGYFVAKQIRLPDYGGKLAIFFLTVAIAVFVLLTRWPPKLGIDLSGGVTLVYEVEGTVRQAGVARAPSGAETPEINMDQLIAALNKRVNPAGVKEVTIRRFGPRQIEIIVPEVDEDEVNRLERVISSVGTLEFRILANSRDHRRLIERAQALASDELELYDDQGNLLAWWVPVAKGQEQNVGAFGEVAVRQGQYRGEPWLQVLVVKDPQDVTGADLLRVRESVDEGGRPCVAFVLRVGSAQQRFATLTSENRPDPNTGFERRLGIILDGYLYSAPTIRSTISAQGQITGNFTQEEVRSLLQVLEAGSLPAMLSPQPISRLITGPQLGRDTIRQSVTSMIIAAILVFAFMIAYYRFAGVIACIAVVLNLVMLVAVMIMVKAAFTLPGLAGLTLTVGMAVDANVLIYERIREELSRQATLRMAIRNGFERAMSAIVDSNLTTMLTAAVLYAVGTDQVRGFAVTLFLGLVLNLYTAVFLARMAFEIFERKRWIKKLSMMQIISATNYDFMGMARYAIVGSVVVIAVGVGALFMRGQGILDIDFTGGVAVELLFKEPKDIGEVRYRLRELRDLAVSDVRLEGEEPHRRFVINTAAEPGVEAQDYLNQVKKKIADIFGEELVHYSLELRPLTETGAMFSPGRVGGLAGTGGLALSPWIFGQAESVGEANGSPSAAVTDGHEMSPTSEAAKSGAEDKAQSVPVAPTPPVTDGEESAPAPPDAVQSSAAQSPAAESPASPGSETQSPEAQSSQVRSSEGRSSEAPVSAAQRPETGPRTPAPSARSWPTRVRLVFDHKIDYDTVNDLVARQLAKLPQPEKNADYEIFNREYRRGDTTGYNEWEFRIDLPPEAGMKVAEQVREEFEAIPFFPSSNTIGGKVAGSTRVRAGYALLLSVIGIIVYLWVRFTRFSFGLAAALALLHDVLVTVGLIALSAYLTGFLQFLLVQEFKIGLSVLAALLTIVGYSVNDTIVVFDRIREVKGKNPNLTIGMINSSINQTLSRTLITALTTLFVIVVLYIGGGAGIHGFAFTLLVGVTVGTYSSIFIASPILMWLTALPESQVKVTKTPQYVS